MYQRPIHDEVMSRASRLASDRHPLVAERHADELARYARVTSACDALESFLGFAREWMMMCSLCYRSVAHRSLI